VLNKKRESEELPTKDTLVIKKPKIAGNEDSVDDFAEQLLEGMCTCMIHYSVA
jgi:hypothetical protein